MLNKDSKSDSYWRFSPSLLVPMSCILTFVKIFVARYSCTCTVHSCTVQLYSVGPAWPLRLYFHSCKKWSHVPRAEFFNFKCSGEIISEPVYRFEITLTNFVDQSQGSFDLSASLWLVKTGCVKKAFIRTQMLQRMIFLKKEDDLKYFLKRKMTSIF